MDFIKWIIGGAVGGAIGAAIWAGVTYSTGWEIGWIAWGVGVLAGLGVLAAARDSTCTASGAVAASIALAAILGGKYAALHFAAGDFITEAVGPLVATEERAISRIADSIVPEYERGGKALAWPEGSSLETARDEADYPADLWADAAARWELMSPEARADYRAWVERDMGHRRRAAQSEIAGAVYWETFTLFDALWFFLALGSAYKIGAGLGGE